MADQDLTGGGLNGSVGSGLNGGVGSGLNGGVGSGVTDTHTIGNGGVGGNGRVVGNGGSGDDNHNNDISGDNISNDILGVKFSLLPKTIKDGDGDDDDDDDDSTSKHDIVNMSQCMTQEEDADSLFYVRYENLHLKDFHAEIRAIRDVDLALSCSVVLLDLHANSLSEIVQSMLSSLVNAVPDCPIDVTAAKPVIFASQSECVVSRSIQGKIPSIDMGGIDTDQAWLCIMSELPELSQRYVSFARLQHPMNLGPTCQEAQFVILIVAPGKEKATKNIVEIGKTFSTLFTDVSFRHKLLLATSKDAFRRLLRQRAGDMAHEQGDPRHRGSTVDGFPVSVFNEEREGRSRIPCCRGLIGDLKRRLPHYWSDYVDGFRGSRTPQKVSAAIFFLYFACVLPNLAFGMLNSNNTRGAIGVNKILFSQMFGGLAFALFGGQPLIVLLTTAPLALYTKIIFNISEDFGLDFRAMYACVGLWNAGFLVLYSVLDVSKLMKWSSRSTEEIFSLFITFAFSADAIRDCIKDFNDNYNTPACHPSSSTNTTATTTTTMPSSSSSSLLSSSSSFNVTNTTAAAMTMTTTTTTAPVEECLRESSILFLLLMLCTVWVGLTLFNFTKTPYLTAGKREILADYALPISVLFVSFLGSYVFRDVKMQPFTHDPNETMFEVSPLSVLSPGAVAAAAGLGFCLSLLFFMDQNISSALVNTPNNKLKKGAAYHWDLLVVALINGFLSVFSFPWVHAALPHSPLHVRALADVEERVDQGHVHQIVVHVRETRVTGIVSHVMIGLSMLMLPVPLTYIPRPVLDGLFLYVAVTALYGNQLFDRVMLLFTEQTAYPPNHYVRRVPQRKVHTFTFIQLLQLAVLCVFGFSPIPYMKMVFPVLLMFLMPLRHKLVPKFIEPKFLKALDGH